MQIWHGREGRETGRVRQRPGREQRATRMQETHLCLVLGVALDRPQLVLAVRILKGTGEGVSQRCQCFDSPGHGDRLGTWRRTRSAPPASRR